MTASTSSPSLHNKKISTVLIMAAGTGGHVFPALAVAEELRRQGVSVHWLATLAGMEHRLVGKTDIPLHPIDIQGLRGNGIKRLLTAPFKILLATLAAMRLMRALNIDAVAGFGGYVSGPGGLAARLLGIPLIIQEQNAIAGLTNKKLASVAKLVLQAFPNTFPLQDKVKTTGNPVRHALCDLPLPAFRYAERATAPLNVLVVGGSLGAQALNEHVPGGLAKLGIPLHIRHQCGQQQVESTTQRYNALSSSALDASQLNVEVLAFVDDMAAAYAAADLVICRAGALTVTELATVGVAAVFIPLPSAVDDHQTVNAGYLADSGAAIICPQSTLNADSLAALLTPLMNRTTLKEMAVKARQKAHPNATQEVAQYVLSLHS